MGMGSMVSADSVKQSKENVIREIWNSIAKVHPFFPWTLNGKRVIKWMNEKIFGTHYFLSKKDLFYVNCLYLWN